MGPVRRRPMEAHDFSGGCPTRDELAALACGRLTGAAQTTIADHVSACPRCAAAYDGLDVAGSRIVTLLRGADETAGGDEPEALRLEARAAALRGDLSPTPLPPSRPGTDPHAASRDELSLP